MKNIFTINVKEHLRLFGNLLAITMILSGLNPMFGQSVLEWSDTYKLQKSDFMGSKAGRSGDFVMIHAAGSINFSYHMSNYEFMLTKNFNGKVTATINRLASFIVAPDSLTENKLLKFGQAEFDLMELYTRKFRKSMFESKKAFSDPGFYQKLYDDMHSEYTVKLSELNQNSNMGMAESRLEEQHNQILKEIELLSDYCKDCKPKKKKKGA